MKLVLLLTLLSVSANLKAQSFKESKYKVKFYNYCDLNKRVTLICSSDTLSVTISNLNDSIFKYESVGYFGTKISYNRYKRELKYSNNFFDEESKSIRDYFVVKDIDFKNFEYGEKKILVYRFLITNTKVDDGNILVFFCKEYGILLQKPLGTNGLIRYEFIDDPAKNIMLNYLYAFILSDNKFSYIQNWKEIIKK